MSAHADVTSLFSRYSGDRLLGKMISDEELERDCTATRVAMVFECPSSTMEGASFVNHSMFPMHDMPPPPLPYWIKLRPIRYSVVAGSEATSLIHPDAMPSQALVRHWTDTIPNFEAPNYAPIDVTKQFDVFDKIVAYLPTEAIPPKKAVTDPTKHYQLASKAEIANIDGLVAPEVYPDTKFKRPCVVKLTHGLGSVGIFIIRNDDDEEEWLEFYNTNHKPTFIVVEFLDIVQNLAAHFFVHRNGNITWFGYSENVKVGNDWVSDTTFDWDMQTHLMEFMEPHVRAVANHALTLGFCGAMGIDVIIDSKERAIVLDINPRVTGTMPALMLQPRMAGLGFNLGLFSKSTSKSFNGTEVELFQKVSDINKTRDARVVVFSSHELSSERVVFLKGAVFSVPARCLVNYAVYSNSQDLIISICNEIYL